MPEDRPSNGPPDDRLPNDTRDERLASRLEVPPLDDVTRRRLVRRALDEPGALPQRRRLAGILGIAAAALLLVVGAAVVLRDDGGGDHTAARPAGEDAGKGTTDEAAAAPSALGELGEVSDPAVLQKQLSAGPAAPAPPPAESEGDEGPDQRGAAAAGVPPACLTTLEQVGGTSPTFAATATYQRVPALVLVATKDGGDVAFVLDAATCELRSEVPLG